MLETFTPRAGFVRLFKPSDRQALLTIGSDTGYFGAPIEKYLDDRRVFEDAFFAYYTDYEPQHAWIAVLPSKDGAEEVVGFLTGCVDPQARSKVMKETIMPAVIRKWLTWQYRPGLKTYGYALRGWLALMRGEVPKVDEEHYPAHLHINLLPHARGLGLGSALMLSYLNQLKGLGTCGVHLETTSMNRAAVRMYERVGFKLLEARQTKMWRGIIDEPVENRVYGLDLSRYPPGEQL